MSLDAAEMRPVDGSPFRFGIVAARFNPELVEGLLGSARETLLAAGVKPEGITVVRVPGSHEVPWAAQALARGSQCDCVIGL
ncbi:MAG: 6,7-dimethyl-8-ribityllumazine synthase, partial [Opitutus sp.]